MAFRQLVISAALVAAPLASAAAHPVAVIHNRAPFVAHVRISYAACRGDTFKVEAARAGGEVVTKAPGRRGACLITGVSVTLTGTSKHVTAFKSNGTSHSKFIIAPEGNDFRVLSEPK